LSVNHNAWGGSRSVCVQEQSRGGSVAVCLRPGNDRKL